MVFDTAKMPEQDLQNYSTIFDYVKRFFALSKESLKRFEESLYYPDIDETYLKHLDSDLRCRTRITHGVCEKFDVGWEMFKNSFSVFCKSNKVTYENYRQNKINFKKNIQRLFRSVKSFYVLNKKAMIEDFGTVDNHCFDRYMSRCVEEMSISKMPENFNIEIVLSLNFADWFLSATNEGWTSCLNLESQFSGATWTGLPGLVIDKNRGMIYITNGCRKYYKNISTERCLSRSWTLLDNQSKIRAIRYFPYSYFSEEQINNIVSYKIQSLTAEFVSKYSLNLLKFDNNSSCFIYKDFTKFNLLGGKEIHMTSHNKGCFEAVHFTKKSNQVFDITNEYPFHYENGFSYLLEQDINLNNVTRNLKKCIECGERYPTREMYNLSENEYVCENCFNESYFSCENCDAINHTEDSYVDCHDNLICEYCYGEYYVECCECGSVVKENKALRKKNGDFLCSLCF